MQGAGGTGHSSVRFTVQGSCASARVAVPERPLWISHFPKRSGGSTRGESAMQRVTGGQGGIVSVAIITGEEVMKMTGNHVIKRGHRLMPLMHTDRGGTRESFLSRRYTKDPRLLQPAKNG